VKRSANSNEVEVAAPKEVKMACVKNPNVKWLPRLLLCMLLRIIVLPILLMFSALMYWVCIWNLLMAAFYVGCLSLEYDIC
jgi:hypothetical protein